MKTHRYQKPKTGSRTKRYSQTQRAHYLARAMKMTIRALISVALIYLFGLVIFAFVVKAFVTTDEISLQLLNSAITLVGSALGYVLGYFLSQNSNGRSDQQS